MTAQIWPFKPRDELIESLEWLTDIFQAKAAEKRIALREAPRRTFNIDHILTDGEYTAARALIRAAQGADGFLVPDWTQATNVGAITAGSGVSVSANLSSVDMGDTAILWESLSSFEAVGITDDSSGVTLDSVSRNYTSARLMPLISASCPDGLSAIRSAGGIIQASVAMVCRDNSDLGFSAYPQYRSLDVLTTCPIIGGGSFDESIGWDVSTFDNQQSIPHHIRRRSYPDLKFQMRWHEFSRAELWDVRQWLHSRRGRQKAFWMSSRGHDLNLAVDIGASDTEITVFAPHGVAWLGRTSSFDIEIKTLSGTSYYRKVTGSDTGTPVDGADTIDLTIDSPCGAIIQTSDIDRISFLRCCRLDADRIELQHKAAAGTAIQVPCIEIPEP